MANFENLIGEFSENIVGKNIDKINITLANTLKTMGYGQHAYHILRVPKFDGGKTQFFVDTDYGEEWFKLYEANNYINIDTVVSRGISSPIPFHWNEVTDPNKLSSTQEKFHNQASDFGIKNGCSFPIFSTNSHSMLSVTPIYGSNAESIKLYEHSRMALHTIALIHNNYVADLLLEEFLTPFRPNLTPRETEILTWSARGKTVSEIGQILNISIGTVRFHQTNYMEKLEVSTVQFAVCKAIVMGLIKPFDNPRYDPYQISGMPKMPIAKAN